MVMAGQLIEGGQGQIVPTEEERVEKLSPLLGKPIKKKVKSNMTLRKLKLQSKLVLSGYQTKRHLLLEKRKFLGQGLPAQVQGQNQRGQGHDPIPVILVLLVQEAVEKSQQRKLRYLFKMRSFFLFFLYKIKDFLYTCNL